MKPHKQTSPAISSIAAKYLAMTSREMFHAALPDVLKRDVLRRAFVRDIKAICASALAQDQTKGQGK